MAWRNREGWLSCVFLGTGRVEDENECNKRRLQKFSWETETLKVLCRSQISIPDTADRSPALPCNNPHRRSSQPNQASGTPKSSYPVISSTSFPSSSPSHSFASTTLPLSQNTKLSRPTLSLHVMIMCWHWVQYTPSTAFTKYSIHGVQHPPSTAYP